MSKLKAKKESEYRSNSGQYNQATKARQLIHEEHNTGRNLGVLLKAFEEGRAKDLNAEPKVKREPCLIIGSGPSLDESLPYLHDWKGGVMCSCSHALTLVKWGIEPQYILSLDPFDSWEHIKGIDWSKTRTKLILHPGVWPDLVENWPNEFLLYRENLGQSGHFYQTEQKHMFTTRFKLPPPPSGKVEGHGEYQFNFLINSEITLFACSPPCQAFAANVLGYGTIFMLGVDFAYHKNKDRFTDWTYEDGKWVKHVHPTRLEDFAEDNRLAITDNGLYTHDVHLYYKKNLFSALRLSWQNAYWLGKGAVTEYPMTDIETLIKTQGRGYKRLSRTEIRRITDDYLARVGCYIIEATPHKMSFVESNDPRVEVHNYMVKMKRKYRCSNCGVIIESPDDTDHNGEKCAACMSPGTITQMAPELDINKNMRRIEKLVDKFHKQAPRPDHPHIMQTAVEAPDPAEM